MVECYFKECPNHCCNFEIDEYPFCMNNECTATLHEIEEYKSIRLAYLEKLYENIKTKDG